MIGKLCKFGIWLYPDAPAHDLVTAIQSADQALVDEVWIADEAVSREPIVLLSAAAFATSHTKLAVGITTPLLRHAGAIGSSMATLDELSGGRAVLGLGVGGHLSLEPFDIRADRPVAVVRDAIRTARSVMQSEPSAYYSPPSHAAPGRSVPIFVGARGEQLLRLASREADGVFLSGFRHADLAQAVAWSRSVRPIHVALYASVRFRSEVADPEGVLFGSPEEIATGLLALADQHQPESIGLALIDGDSIPVMVERALTVFRLFQELQLRR